MKNKSIIKKIYKINDELQVLLETESDLYKKAMLNKDRTVKIKRDEGEVEVKEGELFEEIRVLSGLGREAKQARDKLAEIYPELFEVAEKRENKQKELNEFFAKHLGFSPTQMTIANYLKMTEMVIDYKLEENNKK